MPHCTFGYSTSCRGMILCSSSSSSWEISSQVSPSLPSSSSSCCCSDPSLVPYRNRHLRTDTPISSDFRPRRSHSSIPFRKFRLSLSSSPQVCLLPPFPLGSSHSLTLLDWSHRLLDSQDDFVRLKAAVIASVLLSYDKSPQDEVVTKLISHLSHLIRVSTL